LKKGSIDSANKTSTVSEETVERKEMLEVGKEDYHTFDDYLEMIMTFGYITLFASAFPLASTISAVFIYFESRSDLFKLERLLRRPLATKSNSIGSW